MNEHIGRFFEALRSIYLTQNKDEVDLAPLCKALDDWIADIIPETDAYQTLYAKLEAQMTDLSEDELRKQTTLHFEHSDLLEAFKSTLDESKQAILARDIFSIQFVYLILSNSWDDEDAKASRRYLALSELFKTKLKCNYQALIGTLSGTETAPEYTPLKQILIEFARQQDVFFSELEELPNLTNYQAKFEFHQKYVSAAETNYEQALSRAREALGKEFNEQWQDYLEIITANTFTSDSASLINVSIAAASQAGALLWAGVSHLGSGVTGAASAASSAAGAAAASISGFLRR